MKVVFLFMSKGSATPGSTKTNEWIFQDAGEQYQTEFGDECYFQMLQTLLDDGTITDLKVFFESNVNPGRAKFVKGAECYVIPEIRLVAPFINEDTIIFARGGFKHWHDFLLQYKGKNWLMIYGANTGRHKWVWWDINFDDLNMANEIDKHERYQYPFIKPTNETIFKPDFTWDNIKYDICLGASHIHDKKGQYHCINLLKRFHELYGYYPTAIMPGATRRNRFTVEMLKDPVFNNEVVTPGRVSKPVLSKIFNQCKLFLHLGSCGQNDRSVLEAYACGLLIGIRTISTHTPLLTPNDQTIFHFDIDNDPDYTTCAHQLFDILEEWTLSQKITAFAEYKVHMGYEEQAIPSLRLLFTLLSHNTKPTLDAKKVIKTSMIQYMEVDCD